MTLLIILIHIANWFQHLFEIACDFHKLEKLEACGTNGRVLSAQIESVFEDFVEAFKIFAENGTYDPLEPDSEV